MNDNPIKSKKRYALTHLELKFIIKEILNKLKIEFSIKDGKWVPAIDNIAKQIENELDEYIYFHNRDNRTRGNTKNTISRRHLTRILKDYLEKKVCIPKIEVGTLDLLVTILGYNSFKEYKEEHLLKAISQDSLFDPTDIIVSNLVVGSIHTLGWIPNYYMDVVYLGDSKFRVISVCGDFKKEVGDEFEAKSFCLEYLYSLSEKNMGYPLHPTIMISKEENAKNQFSNL